MQNLPRSGPLRRIRWFLVDLAPAVCHQKSASLAFEGQLGCLFKPAQKLIIHFIIYFPSVQCHKVPGSLSELLENSFYSPP